MNRHLRFGFGGPASGIGRPNHPDGFQYGVTQAEAGPPRTHNHQPHLVSEDFLAIAHGAGVVATTAGLEEPVERPEADSSLLDIQRSIG
jgi:hypothetical protein